MPVKSRRKQSVAPRKQKSKVSVRGSKTSKKHPSLNKRTAQKMPPVKGKRKRSVRDNIKRDYHGVRLTASERRAQKKIVFTTGDTSGKYQAKVREALCNGFTQEELRVMGPVNVEFGPVKYGNRAVFYREYEEGDIMTIRFDPKQMEEDDIVHEFTHALKAKDISRNGYAATLFKRSGDKFDPEFHNTHQKDLSNIEEATVVAEAAIRTKKPAKDPSGYYKEIPGVGKDNAKIKKAYEQDRMLLLNPPKGTKVKDTKGIQGKAAVNKLNENFPKTNISKKKVEGRTAITSYHRLKSIKK